MIFPQHRADNTAYMLRAYALALRDVAHFGRNIVYTGNVVGNSSALIIIL